MHGCTSAPLLLQVEQAPWGVNFRVIFSKQAASTPQLDPGVHYIMNQCYCATVKDGIWVVCSRAEQLAQCMCERREGPQTTFMRPMQVSLTIKDSDKGTFMNDFLLSNDPSNENVAKLKAYLAERAPRMLDILDDDDYRKFFTRSTFTGAVTKCNRYNADEFLLLIGDAAHSVIPPTGEGNERLDAHTCTTPHKAWLVSLGKGGGERPPLWTESMADAGVNSGLEDTRYLAEAFEKDPATAFETYNKMRYRDLQYLGAYAWQLRDNLSGTDKAASIANICFTIFQSTQYVSPPLFHCTCNVCP